MLDFWVKFKEIELYVKHEVDNPIIIDEIFLLTIGEGDVEGVEVDREDDDEGVKSDGEGDLEKVESGGKGDVGEVQADGKGVSATGIEVDKDIGMESGGHISLGSTVGEDNNSEVAGNEYASDFATSDGVDNVADEYVGDFATSDRVDNVADKYAGDFATSDGLDNVAATHSGEEEDGNETEVWDSDEHGSLVEFDEDKEHEDGERRRSKFPLYNDELKFSLGMLFKDGKQFKSAIRKYSKECRRQLKFIKNEPKRVVVRCITSPNCPWRIRASYSPIAKCLQIKTFQDEHYCSVSFKNKMVTAAMIAQHFEATINDHLKMKLREIQRRSLEKKDKDVYDNLMKKFPKMWTRAFLGTTCKSDIVDNNLCEAFNSNIVEARFKSIIRMLEDIRTKIMTRKYKKGSYQNYGPLVKAKFDANKKDCVEWQLIWNGENGCELRKGSYQYTVDLSQRICSCRSWQISGIPCSHACAAMYHLRLQPDEYLHEYYHIDTYKKAYSFPMQPINGLHDCEKTGIQPVLPPIERKMPGRPKKNRRMAKDEPKKLKPGHLSRKGLLMTCTHCGQHGHNKRSCTNSKQQDAQPPKQKGKYSIKRSTTLDKSKGNLPFFASSRTTRSMTTTSCQDGTGQTSSTPKSRNNKRKAHLDHLGTQESVTENTSKSSLFCFE
ncbi:hypothetical protein CXB51_005973 [Gossypium anomalum]|uniref:SWIM-type domain-containing protein n=1 Tax=Gossypium anomalum TaxID=47600 RepID=A0A8J5Z320_9ROSI|nr:hypothetical protein CXB51_005973 [Gossypium anomalum]